jgi:hypothetical protein
VTMPDATIVLQLAQHSGMTVSEKTPLTRSLPIRLEDSRAQVFTVGQIHENYRRYFYGNPEATWYCACSLKPPSRALARSMCKRRRRLWVSRSDRSVDS